MPRIRFKKADEKGLPVSGRGLSVYIREY